VWVDVLGVVVCLVLSCGCNVHITGNRENKTRNNIITLYYFTVIIGAAVDDENELNCLIQRKKRTVL
jgi:hypothetical protein